MSERPARGTLYLIPVDLGGENAPAVVPASALEIARRLECFVVENAKSARGFLKAIGHPRPIQQISIEALEGRDVERPIAVGLQRLSAGTDCGLLSEAGCPAVADPGAELVRRAHEAGIRVAPLVGPSSILLALMASGMDGQHFEFHGYLPADSAKRAGRVKALDARCAGGTQIFIETPHRSAAMLATLLDACRPDTLLCVASDLTAPAELVETRPIAAWKKKPPDIARRPVVFLLWRRSR